jgi:hypothetical protein
MRTLAAVAIAGGLSLALVWLPVSGMWWHVVRWAYYLPIVLVSAGHGPIAGLFAGVAASLFYGLVAASRGTGDMAWLTILAPDLAVVGLFGGSLLERWSGYRRRSSAGRADAWSPLRRTPEPAIKIDLNSLASIESAAGLLGEDDTPTALRQELVGIISTECEHLSASIVGLVQQDRRAAPPEFHEADLTAIIAAAVREAEFVLWGHGFVVRNEIAPDLPPIQCNPDQIRGLLISLIVDAVQSVPAGGEVVLNARRGDDGVILDVRDRGKGSFVSWVAKRFFGSRSATTGVGLAASDIVRHHGGMISAKVDFRKGSEFSVWLPIRRDCASGGGQGASGGRR